MAHVLNRKLLRISRFVLGILLGVALALGVGAVAQAENSSTASSSEAKKSDISDVKEVQQGSAPQSDSVPRRRPPVDPDDPEVRNSKDDPNVVIPQSIRDNFGIGGTNNFVIGAPRPGGSGAGVIPDNLRGFYTQQIKWESCDSYSLKREYANARFQCGYVIVPMDYTNPLGPTIAVSVLKLSSTSAEKKGTLFMDPGGPGASGMWMLWRKADQFVAQGLLEDFDLIGFDPRGVGSAAPAIRCISDKLFDAYRESDKKGWPTDYMRRGGCTEHTWSGYQGIDVGGFLRSVGTNNVVKDLDVMRSVVGDQRLNYLGYSYGTSIGYQYALNFPENIRAMVLDGNVNPFENNFEEDMKYEEFRLNGGTNQGEAAQEAQDQFLSKCSSQDGFEYKGKKYPCALGTSGDLKTLNANLARLEMKAGDKSFWSESLQRLVSRYDFETANNAALYSERLWPQFNAGLNAASEQVETGADDPDARDLLDLADMYLGRSSDGVYDNAVSAFLQIGTCVDMGAGCNGTSFEDAMRTGESIAALTNVLVISGTYDNATPYPNGVVMAKGTGSTLLSVANNAHGAYLAGINCVDDIATTYLRSLNIKENPGAQGVDTKDIYSNKITGNQCQIDTQWRAVPNTEARKAKAGDTLEITAAGLTRGGKYQLTIKAKDGSVLFATQDPVVASSTGTITIPVVIPAKAAGGDYTILVSGAEEITQVLQDASNTLTVTATVKPTPAGASVQVSAPEVVRGAEQTVIGTGFTPGAVLKLKLSPSTDLGEVVVDENGGFTKTFPLPAGTELGKHQVVTTGEDDKTVEAGFDVIDKSPEPSPTPTPSPTPEPSPTPTPGPSPSPSPEPGPRPAPSPTPAPLPDRGSVDNPPVFSGESMIPVHRGADGNFLGQRASNWPVSSGTVPSDRLANTGHGTATWLLLGSSAFLLLLGAVILRQRKREA